VVDNSSVKLSNITVKNNSSGGISFLWNNNSELENVSVIDNGEVWRGGGIFINGNGCNPVLKNVLVAGNQADDAGGGMYYSSHSNPTLINVTLSNNTAYNGSGSIYSESNNLPEIHNSIIWNNSPPELYGSFTIANSDVQGGYGGEGNIDQDPLFSFSVDHPYLLSSSSPCINAGNPDTTGLFLPSVDLVGNPRIWNERIDMGAYEWNNLGFENQPGKDKDQWLRIYPNPAGEIVDLRFTIYDFQRVSIRIIDPFGKEIKSIADGVKSPGEHTVRIDVSALPPGVYLVKVQAGNECAAEKLVVR
jgi:hypothetical protein